MRPTGVTLIAVFHFLAAAFLVGLGLMLMLGGTLPLLVGAGPVTSGLGLFLGLAGAVVFMLLAIVAFLAGYGTWTLREWGRILSIVLAVISLLYSFPGLLMMGLHLQLFIGTYRLFRIAIAILMIWYLMQPQIRAVFRHNGPAAPAMPH
jgi:hypothetical protein